MCARARVLVQTAVVDLEAFEIPVEAPDARNDVLRTLHPPFHLFFHRPLGSTKSNLEHRTRVSSLTISSVRGGCGPRCCYSSKQYFRSDGKWWVSERERERRRLEGNCTSDAWNRVDEFVYSNSYGNSVSRRVNFLYRPSNRVVRDNDERVKINWTNEISTGRELRVIGKV